MTDSKETLKQAVESMTARVDESRSTPLKDHGDAEQCCCQRCCDVVHLVSLMRDMLTLINKMFDQFI